MEMKHEQIKVKVVAVNKCKHALPLKTLGKNKNGFLKTKSHLWVIIKKGSCSRQKTFSLIKRVI